MRKLRLQKTLLAAAIAVTALLPLAFVDYREPTAELSAVKALAKAGSLAGTVLLMWQFVLGFRGISVHLLSDVLWCYQVHKQLGVGAAVLILLHPVFITVYYLRQFDVNLWALAGPARFTVPVVLGIVAAILLAVVVVTSVVRSTMPRKRWFRIHLLSYVMLPIVFVHSLPIGMTLGRTPLKWVWVGLMAVLAAIFAVRLLARLGLLSSRYSVVDAQAVASDCYEISMMPLRRALRPAIGQFVYTRRGRRATARPYTVSHFDDATGRLAVTIKAAGPTSGQAPHIAPGEELYLDGPYGVFTWEAMESPRPVIMIAGGIGITAFVRLAEHLERRGDRPAWLFYGNTVAGDIAYKDELDSMRHVKVVHVISDQDDYPGEKGFITPELLEKYVDQPLRHYEILLCGPGEMIDKLEPALKDRQVPGRQIHHELFGI